MTQAISGKMMIESLDCQACHRLDAESIGPSYVAVAERYEDSSDVQAHLVNKVINGGSGVWGETVMPAHLDISEDDARKIVSWIMSLNDEQQTQESLPAEGSVQPTLDKQLAPNGLLILSASYTDQGGANVKPLTGNTSVYLRNNTMSFTNAANLQEYSSMTYDGNFLLMVPEQEGSFSLNGIDLTGVGSATLMTAMMEQLETGYEFELRLGAPDGQVIGSAVLEPGSGSASSDGQPIMGELSINIDEVDGQNHDLYITSRPQNTDAATTVVLSAIRFNTN
ncbi:MAG: c-type cytochrome [Balneolaceae bacterium]|nr:c-type cytochrome [Balneolaceae bacterium]